MHGRFFNYIYINEITHFKMMKDYTKELTEGMQHLCNVANRVVQSHCTRIDVDLMLERLRGLYDVALEMAEEVKRMEGPSAQSPTGEPKRMEGQEEVQAMAMVSTMAAMQGEKEDPSAQSPRGKAVPAEEQKEEEIDLSVQIPTSETVLAEEQKEEETDPSVQTPTSETELIEEHKEEEVQQMPLMEELEGNDNALLFDEVIIEQTANEPKKVENEKWKEREQTSLLDYLNQPVATVGERLESKVDDLRTVINIGDKFSFMSELFKGDMKAYNDFIMRLNAMTDREEALGYVHEVAKEQKWDEEGAAVLAFYKVFDKKF